MTEAQIEVVLVHKGTVQRTALVDRSEMLTAVNLMYELFKSEFEEQEGWVIELQRF